MKKVEKYTTFEQLKTVEIKQEKALTSLSKHLEFEKIMKELVAAKANKK